MSQKSTTFSTRVSPHKLASWKAGVSGSFNAWVVSALDAQFDLDRAEGLDKERAVMERLAVVQQAFPQQAFPQQSFRPDPK